MPTAISVKARDKSTFVVNCAFTDENSNSVAPTSLKWTLTDGRGNIVNSREDVVVSGPSSSEDIVLKGNDLKFSDGVRRCFIVEATYNSSLGTDLPLNDFATFNIDNVPTV